MIIKQLTLTQFRVFEQVTFDFHPGMNLLVGINGVGKSTVLDALRILLSQVLPKFTASKSRPIAFTASDIKFDRAALTAEIKFDAEGTAFNYLVHQPHENYIVVTDREGEVRGQTYDLVQRHDLQPDVKDIPKHLKTSPHQPLAVYFSTRRSLSSMAKPSKQISAGGQAAAFAEALSERELRLREFADWLLVQQALVKEGKKLAQQHLNVLECAVTTFLNKCTRLRVVREPETTLVIDKEGVSLDVRQLSDGERGILALVLDLAKRLSQANPESEDPLGDGKAVVLIDELDLHLHPVWQRTIVDQLTQTFPNCQFIATTHSPQIVGEVLPESILLLESGQQPFRPDQSLGMDSNWVLRYLMGATTRDSDTEKELKRIADIIENEEYDQATDAIDLLRDKIGEFPELVRLQTRIDRIRLLGE